MSIEELFAIFSKPVRARRTYSIPVELFFLSYEAALATRGKRARWGSQL